jgi:hypothetical protein
MDELRLLVQRNEPKKRPAKFQPLFRFRKPDYFVSGQGPLRSLLSETSGSHNFALPPHFKTLTLCKIDSKPKLAL